MKHLMLGGLVQLDLPTLLVASSLVVTICGVIFVLGTVRQHHDVASRLWSAAFTLGILTMVSLAVWAASPDLPVVIGVGNGALAMSMGAIWAGNRAFNERRSHVLIAVIGGLLVAVVTWADPAAGSWAGGQLFLIAVSVFSLLAGAEALTGRMRRSLNALILAVVVLGVGVFYAVRSVIFAIVGPDSALFEEYFGTDITTAVTILFVITASTSMAVLRTEGLNPRAPRILDTGRWERFASAELFATAINDRLERTVVTGEPSVLIRVEIDNLTEMNTAFGRTFSESAMTLLGTILRDRVSASAVLGHSGGAGFDALVFENLDSALDRAKSIRSGLIDTPIDSSQGLRISATIALIVAEPGETFTALAERAAQLMNEGRAAGGNVIVGHPEEYSRV
jgi:GGDEF domain-containing protein